MRYKKYKIEVNINGHSLKGTVDKHTVESAEEEGINVIEGMTQGFVRSILDEIAETES